MSDFKNLDYHMMPVDGGQIVDISYAVDEDYLYQRSHDKSDNTISYSRASLDLEGETAFEPQNNQLPDIDGDWESYETRFRVWDDGNSEIIEAEDMDAAKEKAEEMWQNGSWDGKCLIDVYIQEIDWDGNDVGDREEIEVECGEDPEEPECVEDEHEWESPHEVVGGLSENPGVWSLGGTTIRTVEVCKHCGWHKKETNYGAQRNPQQCDTIEYMEPDESSLAWVESLVKND